MMISTPTPRTTQLGFLHDYDIDLHTGFVPAVDPIARLGSAFESWEAIVPELSALIRSRRLRERLANIEPVNPLQVETHGERERALLLLTTFANGWVWGGEEPCLEIPARISVPLCAIATALDRPPIVHYASTTLNNWSRVDRTLPVGTENMRMQVQFLGGVDEDWFFIGSIGVELAGAPLPALIHAAILAAQVNDDTQLTDLLGRIIPVMDDVLHALGRMREWCDPYIFYHRVRPFLAGWPAPGAIYSGVSCEPLQFVGGSAGQSSLIQAIDALLGVNHGDSPAGKYLRHVRGYMPVGHRRFVEDVEALSQVRARALHGSTALRDAYNAAIERVDLFRRCHIEIAIDYVTKPSGSTAASGTGGTAFAEFLGAARRHTIAKRIGDA